MKKSLKLVSISVVFISLALMTVNCSKDDKDSDSNSNYVPTVVALNSLFNSNLDDIKQTATFDAGTTFTFTSTAGTTVVIDGTCLRKNGNPVTGNVDLEFIELYDRGTMAITNKPTLGVDTNGDLVPMDSGGEFKVAVKQNGIALTSTCYYQINTPTSLTGGTQTGMQPFSGTIDAAGNLTWAVAQGVDFYLTTTPDKYNTLLSNFDWFNYDKLPNIGPRTEITVNIPTEYVNASTLFLSTNARPNSLGGLGGKYSIGLQCNIIFLAEENGSFRYAIKPITIVNNQQVTFSKSETTVVSAAQMKTILNNLP